MALRAASVAVTCTIYVLFAPTSSGASKSLAVIDKVLPASVNRAVSAPPVLVQVTASLAVRVCERATFSGREIVLADVIVGAISSASVTVTVIV